MKTKYVKLEDVLNILRTRRINTRSAEIAHELEHCDRQIKKLPTIDIEESSPFAEWIPEGKSFLGCDYRCSGCGKLADEGNSGHFNILTAFCKNCGRKMKVKEN